MLKFTIIKKISLFFRRLDNKIENYTRYLLREMEENAGP